ncbi:CDC48 family AAA ATPase [Methanoregula sp.]|uniref:CDC48 family AAA ATPase n=1 Tax=Methanoregula sp. TaxID=2052170 RepID=UPI003567CD8A
MMLKVSAARNKDIGRGIGRIDPKTMEELGAGVGDIIEISGKRTTCAKVMPSFPEDRGKGTIQIDGIVRKNVGIGINETVEIKLITIPPVSQMVLQPLDRFLQKEVDSRLFEGIPVTKGDQIRLSMFGKKFDFLICDATPEIGLISRTTVVKIHGKKTQEKEIKKSFISYEDIGGLKGQVDKIREMIELPLKYPELFERIGIDPPRGVLLYGPPGTGKTLIAKAAAQETDAYLIFISGPEIVGKYYGESEARLREVFAEAQKNAPSIVFIDEIDAIAPKREDVGGDKQVERRIVAQLLSIMDGLKDRGQVIVIATTNLPNSLDPALRRPGRFDREIMIPIPDREGRREIIEIHTRGMPLAADVDLDELANITHGYVGADLAALSRESAMHALRKILPDIDFKKHEVPYELIATLTVKKEDFLNAFREIEPSALREVFVEIPDVSWENVGGLVAIKDEIREAVELPLKCADLYAYAAVTPPKGILLYGPPGTGKTLIAKAIAHETQSNFISIKGPELLSRFVGESERGIREIFKKARQAVPCIIFFDEIDAIAPVRGGRNDNGVTERVIAQLLTEMDGLEELKGVTVLAASNRIDMIDPALLRAGRMDLLIELPKPDEAGRLEIFGIHTKKRPLAKGVKLAEYARDTEGLSGAEIEAVCNRATILAIREFAKSGQDQAAFVVTSKHFLRAVEDVWANTSNA